MLAIDSNGNGGEVGEIVGKTQLGGSRAQADGDILCRGVAGVGGGGGQRSGRSAQRGQVCTLEITGGIGLFGGRTGRAAGLAASKDQCATTVGGIELQAFRGRGGADQIAEMVLPLRP